MTILGLILVLIVLALLLPALGVKADPQIMRVVTIILVIAAVVWLFTGSGLIHA
jgi:hypothetical protein